MGISIRTCLPAFMQTIACSAWAWVGVARITASGLSSEILSSSVVLALGMLRSSANDSILALLNDLKFDTRWKTFLSEIDIYNLVSNFNTKMVGASGAIMGVLVAFGIINPNAELMLIFFPIPIKAKYFIPGIISLDLFSAITGVSIFSPSNTAYIAHIGGALTGFIIMYFWKRNQFDRYRWN